MFEESYEKVASKFEKNDKTGRFFLCHCCPYLTSTIIRLRNHIKRKHEIVMNIKNASVHCVNIGQTDYQ